MTTDTDPTTLARELAHAVTRYDRRQAGRRDYNPYALGQYLLRVDAVLEDVANGAEVRAAIVAAFTGRLRDHVLRFVGQDRATADEDRGAGLFYTPASREAGQ